MKKIMTMVAIIIIIALTFAACGQNDSDSQNKSTPDTNKTNLTNLTIVLDWIPNTNHTGIFVARDLGYFEQEGLAVNVVQAGQDNSLSLLAGGKADFGITFQEELTVARSSNNPLPVKGVAAIIQHNTSGFASPSDRGITSPKDFENKRFGGWGTRTEEKFIETVMKNVGGNISEVTMINSSATDFFASMERDADFSWIYYGWDGIAAEVRGYPINFMLLQDLDERLDFYTPIIAAAESLLNNNPETARKFLRAVSKGYTYCNVNPDEAAEILLKEAPETDRELAIRSQRYLADKFIDDAEAWGIMDQKIWDNFSAFMYENGLIEKQLDVKSAYTNEFLPESLTE